MYEVIHNHTQSIKRSYRALKLVKMKTAIKHDKFQVGDKIIMPNNLHITPNGLKYIPYKKVNWTIDLIYNDNGEDRIILKRRNKLHDKYLSAVQELLTAFK